MMDTRLPGRASRPWQAAGTHGPGGGDQADCEAFSTLLKAAPVGLRFLRTR